MDRIRIRLGHQGSRPVPRKREGDVGTRPPHRAYNLALRVEPGELAFHTSGPVSQRSVGGNREGAGVPILDHRFFHHSNRLSENLEMAGIERLRHQRVAAQEEQMPEAGVGRRGVCAAQICLNESPGILLPGLYIERAWPDAGIPGQVAQVNEVSPIREKPRLCVRDVSVRRREEWGEEWGQAHI
jgi:hypothetical protein